MTFKDSLRHKKAQEAQNDWAEAGFILCFLCLFVAANDLLGGGLHSLGLITDRQP
jgi:hypothetical protein